MSRGGEFYHGTTSHLQPGDEIRPGGGEPQFEQTDSRFAYATTDIRAARSWSIHPDRWDYEDDSAEPHVYEVEPLGRHSKDPERDTSGLPRGNFAGDRRSKVGWRVRREVPWEEIPS